MDSQSQPKPKRNMEEEVARWARRILPWYCALAVLGKTHSYDAALTTLAMGLFLLLTE